MYYYVDSRDALPAQRDDRGLCNESVDGPVVEVIEDSVACCGAVSLRKMTGDGEAPDPIEWAGAAACRRSGK